jgi:cobalamin synthase
VERLYAALRKLYEDRHDTVQAHGWYWAQMEVGRHHSTKGFRRLARNFYKGTSDYGRSASRPAAWLLAILILGFLLYTIPWKEVCPIVEGECAGTTEAIKVVMLAVCFSAAAVRRCVGRFTCSAALDCRALFRGGYVALNWYRF